jgi:hypothetical protein
MDLVASEVLYVRSSAYSACRFQNAQQAVVNVHCTCISKLIMHFKQSLVPSDLVNIAVPQDNQDLSCLWRTQELSCLEQDTAHLISMMSGLIPRDTSV